MTKYELTAEMTENRLEDDGKDWPTKKWRWSLKGDDCTCPLQ